MEVEVMNMAEINAETKEQGFEFRKMKKDEKAIYSLICPQQETYTPERIGTM